MFFLVRFVLLTSFLASLSGIATAQYESLGDNHAVDLGVYPCVNPVGDGGTTQCKSIMAYSGAHIDETTQRIYMWGAGHSASGRTDVDEFWFSDSQWGHGRPSVPCTDMTQANWSVTFAHWISNQDPAATHSYDNLVMVPGTGGSPGKMIHVGPIADFDFRCEPAGWETWRGSGKVAQEYNPTTRTWTPGGTLSDSRLSAEYDPPSGLVVTVAEFNVRTYNPTTHVMTHRLSFSPAKPIFNTGLTTVYFPPNQKHYVFSARYGTVWELTLDRTNWANSTLLQVTGITGTGRPLHVGGCGVQYPNCVDEMGYVYDDVNQVITGGPSGNKLWFFDPIAKTWDSSTPIIDAPSSQTGVGYNNVGSHVLVYSKAKNVYLFISQPASGSSGSTSVAAVRTWIYRKAAAVGPPVPPTVCCAKILKNTSGATITDRPISFGHFFKQGDIPECAHAYIAASNTSLLTQCNALSRWPDGSLKHAIISVNVPTIATAGNVVLDFYNDTVCNDTGGLSGGQLLDPLYNFDATIEMTGAVVRTISARAMLSAGAVRTWIQGPIVTAVIIEDRTTAQSFDTNTDGTTSKLLHPIFEAWFYPQGNRVDVGYTIENIWASKTSTRSAQNQTYSLVLKSGNTGPTTELTQVSFLHIPRSRWHKRNWLGTDPPAIRIDHNLAYMVTTGAIPNYDLTVPPSASLVSSKYAQWLSSPRSIEGNTGGVGQYEKDLAGSGAAPWIGLLPTWDTMYLMTMAADDRMHEVVFGHADLAGRIPWHWREADTLAGTGNFFDLPLTGSVETFGKIISVNARERVNLSDPTLANCGGAGIDDEIESVTGSWSTSGWVLSRDHLPSPAYLPYLLTGRYYYLEELQMMGAHVIGYKLGCTTGDGARQGSRGYFNDTQARGEAWSFRELAYAAFLTPDGTPEKAYLTDKLENNIAELQGTYGQPLAYPAKQIHWNWGVSPWRANNVVHGTYGIPPLGFQRRGNPAFVDFPVSPPGAVGNGHSPFETHFFLCVLGMMRQFGYPVDGMMQFLAPRTIRLVLEPGANMYLLGEYRAPSTKTSPQQWVQNISEYTNFYAAPLTAWRSAATDDFDHSYAMIAMAALSFLNHVTVGPYTGAAAYTTMKASHTELSQFSTESPKWNILPRAVTGTPSPTDLRVLTGGGALSGGGQLK